LNSKIRIYNVGERIPFKYTVIGKIKLGDTGMSADCGWDAAMAILTKKANETGGDACQIIRLQEPDFSLSSSTLSGVTNNCVRLTANIIVLEEKVYEEKSVKKEEIISSNTVSYKDEYPILTPPNNPSFIAVVDFTGNNISEGDCRALTDRLRAELFNTKHYKVIEREMMEQIIKEQGFQQSGCSTDECMVEVGKLIGVEKIVGGSISKVGRTYSVSSRIVSVETGKILKGATYDYKGEIDELLTTGMRMVAYELIK
jgi:TolB-like protein